MYMIKTTTGLRPATLRQAILHAARAKYAADIGIDVQAPRGKKAHLVELARRVYNYRRAHWSPGWMHPSAQTYQANLYSRLRIRLAKKATAEIERRGLSMPAILSRGEASLGVGDYRPEIRVWLATAEGYYKYSGSVGSYFQRAAYLVGVDEGQLWAARVPGTIGTVAGGLAWLKPAAIREAEAKGLPVIRQGDIFFRPMRLPADDLGALQGTRHDARVRKDGGYIIVHPEHKAVRLSAKYRWRAYASTQLHGQAGD